MVLFRNNGLDVSGLPGGRMDNSLALGNWFVLGHPCTLDHSAQTLRKTRVKVETGIFESSQDGKWREAEPGASPWCDRLV